MSLCKEDVTMTDEFNIDAIDVSNVQWDPTDPFSRSMAYFVRFTASDIKQLLDEWSENKELGNGKTARDYIRPRVKDGYLICFQIMNSKEYNSLKNPNETKPKTKRFSFSR